MNKFRVIGFVGAFGSGCSTAAELLSRRIGFKHIKLSGPVRREWKKKHKRTPLRRELQDLGNELRKSHRDPGHLVLEARKMFSKDTDQDLIFDGIRNRGEVEALKMHFGSAFYLIAIQSPVNLRWSRVKKTYTAQRMDQVDFEADDKRDRHQEFSYGQQVDLCVDAADAVVANMGSLKDLERKVVGSPASVGMAPLLLGEKLRYAQPHEILMNLAYSASHGSKCLKRQVGAVIVNAAPFESGEVVGQGYNENPIGTHPCVEEPNYGADLLNHKIGCCYRDLVRCQSFKVMAEKNLCCPKCGESIKNGKFDMRPPWRCPNAECGADLEDFFWPERAMTFCTAVHAEVAAILSAGSRARGATLYTTTFPCFQCAEAIAQAGIRHIVFTESYANQRSAERLEAAKIIPHRFEGIRSGRFDEIFARARPYMEKQAGLVA